MSVVDLPLLILFQRSAAGNRIHGTRLRQFSFSLMGKLCKLERNANLRILMKGDYFIKCLFLDTSN